MRALAIAILLLIAGDALAGPPPFHLPIYDGLPRAEGLTRVRLVAAVEEIALYCAKRASPLPKVTLRVTRDSHHRQLATAMSDDPFARCVAEFATALGGPADAGPRDDFDVSLDIPAPEQLLREKLRYLDTIPGCVPASRAIPRHATIEVGDTVRAIVSENTDAEACVADYAKIWLREFDGIPGLHAAKEVELVPLYTAEMVHHEMDTDVMSDSLSCYRANTPEVRVLVTISGHRGETDLHLTVTANDDAFRSCLQSKLAPNLPRWHDRIDADVTVTYDFHVKPREP
jgi:hypothetical protein